MSILLAFLIALFVSLMFSAPYQSKHTPMASLALFFFFLFPAGIADVSWIVPFGSITWGIAWWTLLFIIFVFAFPFSAPPPHHLIISPAIGKTERGALLSIGINKYYNRLQRFSNL